ncbi:hypothetical protein B0H17DRAFT_678238 [Mycena rosella]|uniref:Uncharacterized protein n=1 Tax=Mycena rosella TaxID=1033263 RepID=A0AAD7GEX3_MYCRO|nr:hypothetical protein B0H17DRAFT_678238 [Mycena rosella]
MTSNRPRGRLTRCVSFLEPGPLPTSSPSAPRSPYDTHFPPLSLSPERHRYPQRSPQDVSMDNIEFDADTNKVTMSRGALEHLIVSASATNMEKFSKGQGETTIRTSPAPPLIPSPRIPWRPARHGYEHQGIAPFRTYKVPKRKGGRGRDTSKGQRTRAPRAHPTASELEGPERRPACPSIAPVSVRVVYIPRPARRSQIVSPPSQCAGGAVSPAPAYRGIRTGPARTHPARVEPMTNEPSQTLGP